jgi:FkbM family methyltransferase
MRPGQYSLQWVKDRVIESGAEEWARPWWMRVTGKRRSSSDFDMAKIIPGLLPPDSTCIDVGAHKGFVLDLLMRSAPQGTFYAFEPIPYLARLLRRKYRDHAPVTIHECALSDKSGSTTFYIDTNAMGYSSLSMPAGRDAGNKIKMCTVKVARLDDLLPDVRPDIIKIDVEGAELGVLRGAAKILARARPTVIFEHGIGGADRFGTTPEQIFDLFASTDLEVSLLDRFLAGQRALSRCEFSDQYYKHLNNNFIAYPGAISYHRKI